MNYATKPLQFEKVPSRIKVIYFQWLKFGPALGIGIRLREGVDVADQIVGSGFSSTELRNKATMNLQAHTYLGESDFSVFTKVYSTQGTEIKETNNFLGFGYTGIGGNGWWFTPWLAGNYTTVYNEFAPTTNTNGFNGGTLGWSAGYVFDAFGESFILSNWTEIEMGRSDEYAENNYGKTGVNGGLNLGWNITNDISATVMYRYYHNKLGNDGYGDILIYRLAYNF